MTITTEQLAQILADWYEGGTPDHVNGLPHFVARQLAKLDIQFDRKAFVEATGEPFEARGRGSR